MTNCPRMPGTVPESQLCVLRPGQKQSGTGKCSGIGSWALIMVKELLHLACKHEVNIAKLAQTRFVHS